MTNHAEWIDPVIATTRCTAAELEVVLLRNTNPPTSWSVIVERTGRHRSTARSLWAAANRKVNGGYVPDPDRERAIAVTDPDIFATWRGIPVVGTRGAIDGTAPGKPTRSRKDAA